MAYELVETTKRPALQRDRTRALRIRLPIERVEPRVAIYAIAIFVFSALDATLTLAMTGGGFAHEVNPFMRALLDVDVSLFVNVKLVVTGIAVTFLAACADRVVLGRIRVAQILSWLVGLYGLLISYEICMLLVGLYR